MSDSPPAAASAEPSPAPVLAPAEVNLVRPKEPVIGRVTATKSCMRGKSASFIRHVCIDVSGTPLEGRFRAGQSFGIVPPGTDANGRPHAVRLYSIASPSFGEDGAGKVLSTTPKRVIDERTPQREGDDPDDHSLLLGVCSNYVCDLRVGDEVRVAGPSGRSFLLPEDPSRHDYLFLATGTGIAPFRGMLLELLEGPGEACRSEIHLVMGAPYTTDLLYDDLLRDLERKHPNFHYHVAISREARPDGRRGPYVHQLVDERMHDTFGDLLGRDRTLVYLCGLKGMQVGLFPVLAAHGFADAYLEIKDAGLAAMDPRSWEDDDVRKRVRPTKRCMVEVY